MPKIKEVTGPLLLVDGVSNVGYDELVKIDLKDGKQRTGQVLEIQGRTA
ncbi:MAG: V-type ATP synthase subunit B, partial [Candidatus Margulisbacteria bacterium]|nr:V-type ATP synthase subunit B [Candidatus Margulisiibacteriota bacterium]